MFFVSKLRFRYVAYAAAVFLIVLLILSLVAFRAEAGVVTFLSDTYVEEGVEVVGEADGDTLLEYKHSWSDFEGVVPDDVIPTTIKLRFSWSLVLRSVTAEPEEVGEATTTTEVEAEGPAIMEEEVILPIETETEVALPDEGETVSPEMLPESVSQLAQDEDETADSADSILSEPENDEPLPQEPVDDPQPTEEHTSSEEGSLEQVSLLDSYAFANIEYEEGIAIEASVPSEGELPVEVLSAESTSTETVMATTTATANSEAPPDAFDVVYTIDGITWHDLGRVGFDDAQQSSFDLTHIGIEAIPNLQVAVHYTVTEESNAKILFERMSLEVGYGELPLEEIVVPLPNDREPNFEVSSVKADVHSENIRAVLLERGGMLEFWYSVTDRRTDEVTWDRLVGGSAIDANAPIGIKERTIFWIDRNQQTLSGFSVDEKSLFGVPFEDLEEKTFLLPFENEDSERWEAIFDPRENSLNFNKVRTKGS